MKRKALLALLAGLLAALGTWSALRRASGGEARAATPPAARAPDRPAPELGATGRVEGPGAAARTSAPARAAPAPEPEAGGEADASGERLQELLAALQADVPFGTLEVLVLEGERPLAGARVLVHGRLRGGPPRELTARLEHGFEGFTDPHGLIAFRGLGADTYDVRVLAPPRPVLEATVIHAQDVHRRVLAVYGSGSISGRVLDAHGAPVEGCPVSVGSQNSLLDGQRSQVWGITDAGGNYRIDGLLADGTWRVTRACGQEQPESVSIALAPGQHARVDFGWPGGMPLWTGTVRDVNGAPVEFPGQLVVRRLDNPEQVQMSYAAEGGFELPLRPGRYAVSAWGYEGSFVLGEIEVPPEGLQRDLELPLARVEVELSYAGTEPRPERVLAGLQVWLRSTPERGGRLPDGVAGDRRSFRAVPPGRYYLVTEPNPLVGVTAQPITVRAGAALERVQLTVGDP